MGLLGASLKKKHNDAVTYSERQQEVFNEIDAMFSVETTAEWANALDAWLDDPAGADVNPFVDTSTCKLIPTNTTLHLTMVFSQDGCGCSKGTRY